MKQTRFMTIKTILSTQYFLFFGVMGVYLPYFNLYCYHLQFTGFQIGVLSSIRSFLLIIMPLVWSFLADKWQTRKGLYVLFNIASVVFCYCFIIVNSFAWMMIIMIGYALFYAPIISFLEAITMDGMELNKSEYGKIRVWGSMSFILMVIGMGKWIETHPIQWVVWIIFWGSLLQAFASLWIPSCQTHLETMLFSRIKHLFRSRWIIFLVSGFFMLLSHATYYGFGSIHLEKLGFSSTYIGCFWALGSLSEIIVMVNSKRILHYFSIEKILRFSFFVAVIRWSILYATSSSIIILGTQLLHAFTYGAFHISSIIFIDQEAPKEAKTLGQAANNAMTYGLGLMIGFFINGYLFEHIGTMNAFGVSACFALTGGLILLFLWR